MNYLPDSVIDLFTNGEAQYRYYSKESMDNNQSMQWFIEWLDLFPFIEENEGTQIVVSNFNFDCRLQIDAGGLGDFYSHSFVVTII